MLNLISVCQNIRYWEFKRIKCSWCHRCQRSRDRSLFTWSVPSFCDHYGIIAISKDSSGIRPSYEISVTEVLIDMWRGIENRWQKIRSLGARQSGFNRSVLKRNEATVDFTQDFANFANKERRFCLIVGLNQTYIHLYEANPCQPTSLQSSAKNWGESKEIILMVVSITAKGRQKQKKTIDFIATLVRVVFRS